MNPQQHIKSVWSQREEAALQEMLERKQRIMSERRGVVKDVAITFGAMSTDTEELTDWAIKHADALRDALAPFDSGTRVGQ